jgi:hypothetical protein
MLLPLMMGIPRAIRLVSKQQMRPAVFTRIIILPLLWFVGYWLPVISGLGLPTSLTQTSQSAWVCGLELWQ